MAKYKYTAEVEIEAENEEDAQVVLINKMDEHDIYWKKEEE